MKRLLSLVVAFLVLSLAVIPHTVFAENNSENVVSSQVPDKAVIPSNLTLADGTVKKANIIAPVKTVFDMNNPNDVIVIIAEGESLADIKAGSASLVKGNDYIVSGNTVKIAKSYYQYLFSKWPAAVSTLTFTMVSGKTDTLVTSSGNSLIIPAKAVFDMNNPSDIIVTLSGNETLSDIKAGSASLINGTDYIVSGNTIKIKKNYYQYIFGKWPTAASVITLIMNSGNSTSLITTSGTQLITPSKVTFDVNTPKGVNITIADGETLADIKAGSASLIKGTDYTVSGNTVTILNYFNYIFITWPNTVCNLTFVMKSGNTATLTAAPDTSGTKLITPNKAEFTVGSRESVEITIANGEELADIKAGSVSLIKDIDYNVYYTADSNFSANSTVAHVRILNYFNYIFSKWPNVACNLTFVTKSGKTSTLSVTARNSITPASINVKKGMAKDQIISFIPDRNIVTSITNNGYTLKKDTDYTLSGSTIVLKAGYLSTLANDTSLTFNFNQGNSASLAITLFNPQPQIFPSSGVFCLDSPYKDIYTNVEDDGLKLTSITNGSTLREGIDYIYADGTVRLNKSYLSSLIGSEVNSYHTSFIFNFTGQNLVYNLTIYRTQSLGTISVKRNSTTENQVIPITANFSDITPIPSDYGHIFLRKDIDYTLRSGSVILYASYLNSLKKDTSLAFNLGGVAYLYLSIKVVEPNYYMTPSSGQFIPDSPNNISIFVGNYGKIISIIKDSYVLKQGVDFYAYPTNTLGETEVVLNRSYLSTLYEGSHTFNINLLDSSYNSTNKAFNFTLTIPDPTISPETISIDKEALADKSIKIVTTDANTISSITNGEYTLKEDIDYTFRKYTGYYLVTLKGSYLSTLTDNTSLVFNLSSGKKLNLPVTVNNTKSFRITLGSGTAESGSIVRIPVIINDIPSTGLAGLQFTAQFDPAYIEAVQYEAGPVCTNPSKNLSVTTKNNNIQVLFIDDTAGDQLLKNEGVLVTLKLTLKKDVKGSTNVKIVGSSVASDIDFNVYPITQVDSTITIK